MVRFFVGINTDGSLLVKAQAESKEGDVGHFRTVLEPGTDAFGLSFDELKRYAQTQGYFDYDDSQESRQTA